VIHHLLGASRHVPLRGRTPLKIAVAALALAGYTSIGAHSVGQVQTTKFLAPQTIELLQNRIAGGGAAGFQAGDVLTYIIQFTPVRNNANTGVAGYITDYIPPGTEVVNAAFVTKDASGNFVNIAPALPGGIDFGWGNRGQKTFLAPFATNAYDPTGRCAAGGFTSNCNARLTELHADTGIFYSTDSRTAVFPALPTRITQGTNGYNIIPTAANQLNPIIGQAQATTHNLWDADQTNAFGTNNQGTINGIVAPKSSALYLGNAGTGATPYLAGSAVAGPLTGYTLDNTGAVGPWQRIAYPGSRIGDPSTGPAVAADISFTSIGGLPTSAGFSLSTSNPLPANTNAVRWAAGKLQVGEIKYVSISLRLTAPPPLSGIQNQSEVFGGDAGDGDNGQDNVWRYHVPSVADNNSNLYIYKTPCQYSASASTCAPLIGSAYPANSTVTYQITYINTGAQPQTNVVLSDVLPCYTGNGAVVRVGSATGPLPISVPFTTTTASAGNCGATPQTRYTVTFPSIASLAPGAGGSLIINVPNGAGTLGDVVINTARLTSVALPNGVSSNAVTTVGNNTLPALALSKVTTTPATIPSGTAQYVVTLQNYGTGPATGIQLDDFLPTNGGAVDPTRRFNFSSLVNVSSSGLTTNSALVTATTTAATTNALIPTLLEPYDTDAGAANRVRVNFNFGTTSSLAAGGVITLTFNVTVGANMSLSPPSYTNDAVARSTSGTLVRVDTNSAAPVNVALLANLSLTKLNGTDTLVAGQTITYTLVASNGGPSPANGAVLRDPTVTGLSCTQITCTPNGASCPAPLDVPTLQGSGLLVPSFPPNTSLTLQLTCGVTATGVP
jgi:uncharacterized repeat protein (TIGR01451 family)